MFAGIPLPPSFGIFKSAIVEVISQSKIYITQSEYFSISCFEFYFIFEPRYAAFAAAFFICHFLKHFFDDWCSMRINLYMASFDRYFCYLSIRSERCMAIIPFRILLAVLVSHLLPCYHFPVSPGFQNHQQKFFIWVIGKSLSKVLNFLEYSADPLNLRFFPNLRHFWKYDLVPMLKFH